MPDSAPLRTLHPDRVPTLTEVIEIGAHGADSSIDAARLVAQVLADIALRIDPLFERSLRDALAPAVARAVGGLLVDSRLALSAALNQLVAQAVSDTLQAHARRHGLRDAQWPAADGSGIRPGQPPDGLLR